MKTCYCRPDVSIKYCTLCGDDCIGPVFDDMDAAIRLWRNAHPPKSYQNSNEFIVAYKEYVASLRGDR